LELTVVLFGVLAVCSVKILKSKQHKAAIQGSSRYKTKSEAT